MGILVALAKENFIPMVQELIWGPEIPIDITKALPGLLGQCLCREEQSKAPPPDLFVTIGSQIREAATATLCQMVV